jgi:hypothetical protein
MDWLRVKAIDKNRQGIANTLKISRGPLMRSAGQSIPDYGHASSQHFCAEFVSQIKCL